MSKKEIFSDTWMVCPNTGYQKPGEQVTSYAIPGGRAMWWRCSTCHRWHMVEKLAPQKRVSPVLTRQDPPEVVRHKWLNLKS